MTGAGVELRRRIVRLVRRYPGLHLRELAREAGTSEQLTAYHLDHLEGAGIIQSHQTEQFRRFYAKDGDPPTGEDRRLLEILRQPVPLRIAMFLLDEGACEAKRLAAALGVSKSTMSYHVSRLTDAGLLLRGDAGVNLVEPGKVEELILRWQPPRTVTDHFTSVWSRFYRGRRE